jgi:hypothetical protein
VRDNRHDVRRIGNGGEIDKDHTISKDRTQLMGKVERQVGFAGPAHAGERDQLHICSTE